MNHLAPLPAPIVRIAALLPAASVPTLALLTAITGGFYGASWYPAALGVLVALAVSLATRGTTVPGRLQRCVLGAAALFAAWSYASIAWAGLPGAAFAAANRAATYAAAIAVLVLVADTPRRRRDLVRLAALCSGALAVYAAATVALAGDLSSFQAGRLYDPIGYPNALASLCAAGICPLLWLAGDRSVAPILRAGALSSIAAIEGTVLLTVSRAGALFTVVGVLLYLVITPHRLRALLGLAATLPALAIAWPTIREPSRRGSDTTLAMVGAAGWAVLASAIAALAVGAAWALVDRRLELPVRMLRVLRLSVAAVAVLAVGAGLVIGVSRDATGFLADKWSVFKAGERAPENATDRYLSAGTNRYDFWRVAVRDLERHPLIGVGAANWSWTYLAQRRSDEEPDNAHGAVWEFAADLGIVGLALYLVVVGGAALAAARPGRREEWPQSAALVAALAITVGHQQVDWLWETFPCGLATAGLIGLAVAGAGRPARRELPRPAGVVAIAAVAVVGIVAITPALLADRYVDQSYGSAPGAGMAAARRAAQLNPFAAAPEIALADAARRAGDPGQVIIALRAAVRREPKAWSAWSSLAAAARADGATDEARVACRAALAINPSAGCDAS